MTAAHLFDRRSLRIAVLHRLEAIDILAALAGVRLAADAIHCHRQRRVRLREHRQTVTRETMKKKVTRLAKTASDSRSARNNA